MQGVAAEGDLRIGAAVVGARDGRHGVEGQLGGRDAARQFWRLAYRVVAVAGGEAAHRDGLARAGVLVGELARARAEHGDAVAAQAKDDGGTGQRDARRAVIRLAHAGVQAEQFQHGRRDGGRQARRLQQQVVAVFGRVAADADGLVDARVLVGEQARCRARDGDDIAAERLHGGRARDQGVARGVVAAALRRHARHLQQGGRDRGRGQRAGVFQHVVAGIGAAGGDAGHRDGFIDARVLVGEAGRGVADVQQVAGHAVVAQGDAGRGGGVVHAADARRLHGQDARRDRAAGVAGQADAVIAAAIAVAERGAVELDRLVAVAGVLVGIAERGMRHRVAGHQGGRQGGQVAAAGGIGERAVVDLADGRCSEHDGLRRDGARAGGAGGQQVVGIRGAHASREILGRQRRADRAAARVAAVEGAAGLGHAERFARNQAIERVVGACQAGRGRAIVGATYPAREAGRQGLGRDAGGSAGRGGQHVVRQGRAGTGREVAGRQAGRHAVRVDHVGGIVAACRLRDAGGLAADETGQVVVGAAQQRCGRAVVGLDDAACQAGRQGLRRDGGRAAGARRQDVVAERGAAAGREVAGREQGADAAGAGHVAGIVQARHLADGGRLSAGKAQQRVVAGG